MPYIVDTVELKKLMAENHIDSIAELELVTGVNRNTLSKVLHGKIYPSAHVIGSLIMALNIATENVGKIFFCPQLT